MEPAEEVSALNQEWEKAQLLRGSKKALFSDLAFWSHKHPLATDLVLALCQLALIYFIEHLALLAHSSFFFV